MEFIAVPISLTKIDWRNYIRVFRDICDESPAAGLDMFNMDLEAPASFLSTLDFENNPHSNMRNPNKSFKHMHMGCVIACDKDFFIEFTRHTDVDTLVKENGREMFVLTTGNMEQWRQFVVSACGRKNDNKESRAMGSLIYRFLCRGGFKDLWYNYKIKTQLDKSITLESK